MIVAHQPDVTRAWTDKVQTGALAGFRKVAILGKKAVAGMHRVGAEGRRGAKDRGDVEVAVFRGGRPDAYGFIGHADVQRVFVGGGKNRDGGYSELAVRANYSNRDSSAIGDQ
jgi:hypothetical protein